MPVDGTYTDTERTDDLLAGIALARFSYEFENVAPELADQAWSLAVFHTDRADIDPVEAVERLRWR